MKEDDANNVFRYSQRASRSLELPVPEVRGTRTKRWTLAKDALEAFATKKWPPGATRALNCAGPSAMGALRMPCGRCHAVQEKGSRSRKFGSFSRDLGVPSWQA